MYKEVIHHHSDSTKSAPKYLLAIFSMVMTEKKNFLSHVRKEKIDNEEKSTSPECFSGEIL